MVISYNVSCILVLLLLEYSTFMHNAKKTPQVQKSEATSEAPVSYIRLKSVISGGGQGLGCFLKYHIAINVYHVLPL